MILNDQDREGAQALLFLYHSPTGVRGCYPQLAVKQAMPSFSLKQVTEASLNSSTTLVSGTFEGETRIGHESRTISNDKQLAKLISALEKGLPSRESELRSRKYEDSIVEILPRLRSQHAALKRRAASVSLETTSAKRRCSSIDSDSAVSEPIIGSQEDLSLRSNRSTSTGTNQRFLLPSQERLGRKMIGCYNEEERAALIEKYLEKRKRRVWTKRIKYSVRKTFADSRLRVKGRFISKDDEGKLREMLMLLA